MKLACVRIFSRRTPEGHPKDTLSKSHKGEGITDTPRVSLATPLVSLHNEIRKPELYGVYVINLKRKKVGGPRIPQGFPKPRPWYLYSMRSKNKEQLSLVLCFCGPLHSIVSGGFPLQPFDTDTPSITWLEICGLLSFHLQEILEPLLTYRFSQAALSDLPKPFKQ